MSKLLGIIMGRQYSCAKPILVCLQVNPGCWTPAYLWAVVSSSFWNLVSRRQWFWMASRSCLPQGVLAVAWWLSGRPGPLAKQGFQWGLWQNAFLNCTCSASLGNWGPRPQYRRKCKPGKSQIFQACRVSGPKHKHSEKPRIVCMFS